MVDVEYFPRVGLAVIGPVIQELPPLLSVSHRIHTSAGVSQREGAGVGVKLGQVIIAATSILLRKLTQEATQTTVT